MASYKLTKYGTLIRIQDGANIPTDPKNRDYAEYLAWLATDPKSQPDPADPELDAVSAILEKADTDITAAEVKRVLLRVAQAEGARGYLTCL